MFYKYQKYKKKYIEIKNQIGGDCVNSPNDDDDTLAQHNSFKDLKFKSSFTNMHNDKMCYCAKDAAQWIYTNSEFNITNKTFPYKSIRDITLHSEYPISINQIWYIIVNNNNNFKELHDMIEQHNYQCNEHEETVRDSKTFLYTQNQKEYIENWLRLLKKYDMFIYSLTGIKEWLKEQIFTNNDELTNIITDAKSLNIILDEARERIYYSENQTREYYKNLIEYNQALRNYNALPSNYKQPDRIDLDVTEETHNPLSILNYINNGRTSNNIKSEITARIYSSIEKVRKHTAEFNFNSFGFTRSPLLNKGYATYDEQISENEKQYNFWSKIPLINQEEFNLLYYFSKKLLDLVDPINKRLEYIESILILGDSHLNEYLRTYDDDVIFKDLDVTQKKNRTIFITHMKRHFTSLMISNLMKKSFETFITGLYYELLYFKTWADSNEIKYNLLTWWLHLYKIAHQNNCLKESVTYIRDILSYRLGPMIQVIALDNFYDVLFLIFIFGYFPYDPLIQFTNIWTQIEYDNSTPIQIQPDILSSKKMDILPQRTAPNYSTYESKDLKSYLNDALDSTIVSPENYKHLISGLYFVILEISDIIFNYGFYNHNKLYYTSNDDNKLIMQTHESNAGKNPIRQLDTTYLVLLKTILKIILTYTQLTTVNKESIEELDKVITSIIKNINLFRYKSAKEYLASRKDELSDKLVDIFGLYKTTNKDIISKIVIEIFNYLKNIIDIKK